ncbi:PH domain-containing protein [Gordonia sp. HNM0687]|uniref:PH domain-containing protein n=1 Tax=Gordonia mangrovi TaxID=2665643 RepID=A0A6L7GT98_9ACTN|nr:PH domain-containing protein [Gordonia mangrovi]MXP23140.1 PH domain-containing protein [Gordonia mangrovi]UVF77421.1 PH domain-containing protein [Gordonia mangrovi]
MSYPRENLAPGEEIVLHRHPHWKCLVGPFLLFVVFTAAAGLLAGVITGADLGSTTRLVLLGIVGVLWLVAFGWFFIRPLVSWGTTHFVLTDRRVIFRNGIITRSGIDIPIRRISTVEFRHGLIDRLLRTGTLIIESASDEPLAFDDIPQVERVHALLYHEVLDEAENEPLGADRYDDLSDDTPGRRHDEGSRR